MAAFHGGAFWKRVGEDFRALNRFPEIVPADVLDAWFPPAPSVVKSLQDHTEFVSRCSPPAYADGVLDAISRARGIQREHLVLGAGSSSLIFLGLRQWIMPRSRVLVLDPMYGEYAHVLENVIGCKIDCLTLRSPRYEIDLNELVTRSANYDWIFLVNPNSPTGQYATACNLAQAIRMLSTSTSIWVDEAYIDYAGQEQSLEPYVSEFENLVVCKSLSKCYALSGLRAAYLACSAARAEELRRISPPWAVSLPAQMATICALDDRAYYAERYEQTSLLREQMADELEALDFHVLRGVANSLLVTIGPDLQDVLDHCQRHGVYLRDVSSMFRGSDPLALRIAVRSPEENRRILDAIKHFVDLNRQSKIPAVTP